MCLLVAAFVQQSGHPTSRQRGAVDTVREGRDEFQPTSGFLFWVILISVVVQNAEM